MRNLEPIGLAPRLRLARKPAPSLKAGDKAPQQDRSGGELLDLLASGQPAAFASDGHERIVFWNTGAAALFGRSAKEALGRLCYEITCGRDVFGNRFCFASCPVTATLRQDGSVAGFEWSVAAKGGGRVSTHATILRIPTARADLFTVVHILQPIEPASRLARTLERLGASTPPPRQASGWAPMPEVGGDRRPLTVREREILHLIAAGLQNKEIAQRLKISLATVRNHIHNILEKLGVHSKLEAVSLAFRSGWIQA